MKPITIDPRFKVGDRVEALDGVLGWRPAQLMQHAPYRRTGTDGYYVEWRDTPIPRPAHVSEGGWFPVNQIRQSPATSTCEVCGGPTSRRERCTNGRCATCHGLYCTPGGSTTPGHGRRWPARRQEEGNDHGNR